MLNFSFNPKNNYKCSLRHTNLIKEHCNLNHSFKNRNLHHFKITTKQFFFTDRHIVFSIIDQSSSKFIQ